MPKHGIRFVCNPVKRVQPESKSLLLEDDETLSYDTLVIASGPRLAFDEIPGRARTVVKPARCARPTTRP